MTHTGHVTKLPPSTKLVMPKMACTSADTVARRCVTGLACASIFKRSGALFFLQSLCVMPMLHNLFWELLPVPGQMKQHYRLSHSATHEEFAHPAASPSLGALIADERDPLLNHDVVEMLSRVIPLLGTPFMVNRFHANGGLKETNNKVVAFQQDSWLPGCAVGLGEAQRPLSASIDGHPAETRFTSTVTSRGCSSKALSRIRQLKLLNSNNTCYLNAFVLSWLHAITQTGCTEYAAFGSRSQAWRDVLYSGKPLHVHALPSWQGILEGWPDVHCQHDAGEMLEHWVAAGRPQVVNGRWEARIAEGVLVEIRHYAATSSPHQSGSTGTAGIISLQQLAL